MEKLVGPRPLDEVIAAITKLRELGAQRIVVGDVEASWPAVSLMSLEPEKPKTPAELAAERERILFASADP